MEVKMFTQELFYKLQQLYPDMVKTRRYLHQFPEISNKEFKTSKYISDFYSAIGLPHRKNVGGNGVVAVLKGAKDGPTIALRADFDALPIHDEKQVDYASTIPGVMHACGHDGHTSQLLFLAKALFELREHLSGTVVFIHQHAEEYAPGGAKFMIDDGCLDGVDVIYGTHLWSLDDLGLISTRVGPIMAGSDRFIIKVIGAGGHGAQPHKTKDAVVIGSNIVISLQQIISRMKNPLFPAVISVGTFDAINAFNIIADSATLEGTVRTFDTSLREDITQQIERVIQASVYPYHAQYEFQYDIGYPPVVNHKEQTKIVVDIANSIEGLIVQPNCDPHMGGEDFAYYLQHVPGSFFFTGAKPKNKTAYPHHHPMFDFDETAMLHASMMLGSLVKKEMENRK